VQGREASLAPLPVQYADYAAWQRSWLEGDVGEQQASYWRAALAGAPALLEVPSDHGRPAQQDFAGAIAGGRLEAGPARRLKALSRGHGGRVDMTLLAPLAALLARLAGQGARVCGRRG